MGDTRRLSNITQADEENLLPYHLLSPEAKKKYDEKKFQAEVFSLIMYEFVRIHVAMQAKYRNEIDNLKKQSQENAYKENEWNKVQLIIDRNTMMDEKQYHKFQQTQTKLDLAIKIIDFRIEELQKFIDKKEIELNNLVTRIKTIKEDFSKNWAAGIQELANDPKFQPIKANVILPGSDKPIEVELERDKQLYVLEYANQNSNTPSEYYFNINKGISDTMKPVWNVYFDSVPAEKREEKVDEFLKESKVNEYFTKALFSKMMKNKKLNDGWKGFCNVEKEKNKLELEIELARQKQNELRAYKNDVINTAKAHIQEISTSKNPAEINNKLDSYNKFTDETIESANAIKANIQQNEISTISTTSSVADDLLSQLEQLESLSNSDDLNPQLITKDLNKVHQKVEELNPDAYKPEEPKLKNTQENSDEQSLEQEHDVELDGSSLRNK